MARFEFWAMKQQTYTLQIEIRGAVLNILQAGKLVGKAIYAVTHGWCLYNTEKQFIAIAKERENILLVFRLRKGRIKQPKAQPRLCVRCPYSDSYKRN